MTTDWAQSSDHHQSCSTMSGNKGNEYVRRFRAKQEQNNRSIYSCREISGYSEDFAT